MKKTPTPAEAARVAAGYDLIAAAKKLNCCPRYLRKIELHGGATLSYARRAARIFNCDGNVFLFAPEYFYRQPRMEVPPAPHPDAVRGRSREIMRRI